MKSYYVSEKTGNRYDKDEYHNHGYGGLKNGFKDLPIDEYPYYEEDENKIDIDHEIKEYMSKVFIELERLNNHKETIIDDYDRRFANASANWVKGPIMGHLNRLALNENHIYDLVDIEDLSKLIAIVEFTDIIDFSNGKRVLDKMVETKEDCWSIIESMGFLDSNSESELGSVIKSVFDEYPDKVVAYKKGNKNLLGLFIGETMKRLKGVNGKELSDKIKNSLEV